MFDKKLNNKINRFLHDNLGIMFEFDFNGLLLLYGDTLKGLIMDMPIMDYSFVLLTQKKDNILDFIKKYDLTYEIDSECGYKFFYNNFSIRISSVNDLCYIGNYSTDYLFYDIHRKQFIPVGLKHSLQNSQIVIYRQPKDSCDGKKYMKAKIDLAKQFNRFMNKNDKKVRVINKQHRSLFTKFYRKSIHNLNSAFVFDERLVQKLDNFIKNKFPVIYEYQFDGLVLLCSGAIRSLIMGQPVKDLDFVVLTQGKCEILNFIHKFKLKYTKNAGGGYKILFENFNIDMFSIDDLLCAGVYNSDMMFFDIERHTFINCGISLSLDRHMITEINVAEKKHYGNKFRLKKMSDFIKYINHSSKKVKIRQNQLLWKFIMFKKHINLNIDKIVNGNFRKCFKFLNNCRKEVSLIILLGLLMSLVDILFIILSGKVFFGILYKDYNLVFIIILLMSFLKIMNVSFKYLFSKRFLVINKKMIFSIRKVIANSILNFSEENVINYNGEKLINSVNMISDNVVKIFESISNNLVIVLECIVILIYIFYLNYIIGIVLLCLMLIIFKMKKNFVRKRNVLNYNYYYNHERYTNAVYQMNYKNKFSSFFYRNIYDKILNFIVFMGIVVIIGLGLILEKVGLLEFSSLIILYVLSLFIFVYLNKLELLIELSFNLDNCCDEIFNLFDGSDYVKSFYGDKYNNKCVGEIEFSKVKFRYKYRDDYVLTDCSFKVASNEVLTIVGNRGSGKTTILKLIARLCDVDDGNVKIDGINIRDYSEQYIRKNISVISQSPYLFDMSIKDNLRLVNENVTDEEIIDVCKLVCIDEFIQTLPNKYDAIIGEDGIKLSDSQKQRLGIARALIKGTKIILLDEILDEESGIVIKKIIKNIQKKHTIIIVTNELSMINDCSRILVVCDGKLVGDGTHKQLIKKSKVYKRLCELE